MQTAVDELRGSNHCRDSRSGEHLQVPDFFSFLKTDSIMRTRLYSDRTASRCVAAALGQLVPVACVNAGS